MPREFRPGDVVEPRTKQGGPSRRRWTVLSRVRPNHDSWFVLDQRGLRTIVTGDDLRASKLAAESAYKAGVERAG
jgi:hypothetical protein